jgi:hypothetical protein
LQIYTALGIDSRPQRVSWAVAQDLFNAPVGYYASRD